MNRNLLSLMLVCAVYQQLNANPTGFSKVAGQAKVPYTDSSGAMVVESGKRAVIEWDSFSVQTQETLQFIQKDKSSAVLNRVKGSDLSSIFGTLKSNGKVFLINPNGIVVGINGMVQTAGFVASTADITTQDFMKDLPIKLSNFGSGEIVNLGVIRANTSDIGLFARTVKNAGSLSAQHGSVHLGAGPEILVKAEGNERLFISVGNETDFIPQVENTGFIEALTTEIKAGGSLYNRAICHSGKIEASRIYRENGKAYLRAGDSKIDIEGEIDIPAGELFVTSKDIHLTQSSKINIAATSGNAGEAIVKASDRCVFEGVLHGESERGRGGQVEFSAPALGYRGNSYLISKTGEDGMLILDPHNILIAPTGTPDPILGNQFFGQNPGTDVTFSGSEISTYLDTTGNLTLQANTDIDIEDSITGTVAGRSLHLQAGRSISSGLSSTPTISLNGGTFSTVINDSGAVSNRDAGDATLDLENTTINTNGGPISLSLGNFGGTFQGNAIINLSSISAGNANIVISGTGNVGENQDGINIANSTITNSGVNPIFMSGNGSDGTGTSIGVNIHDNCNVTAAEGFITLNGTSKGSGDNSVGVSIINNTTITSNASLTVGGVTINGTGSQFGILGGSGGELGLDSTILLINSPLNITGTGQGAGNLNAGWIIHDGGSIFSAGSGDININGTGSTTGTSQNYGILITGNGSIVQSNVTATSNISLTGTAGGNADTNIGIAIEDGAQVNNQGSGTVTLTGTGPVLPVPPPAPSPPMFDNYGVFITDSSSQVTAHTGNIMITGTGGNAIVASGNQNNSGIGIFNSGDVSNDGASGINLIGHGGRGQDSNIGVDIENGTVGSGGNVDIFITGDSLGSGDFNPGIYIDFSSNIVTINGDIILTGTGSNNGIGTNIGIQFGAASINPGSGSIRMTGTGGTGDPTGVDNSGIEIIQPVFFACTGSGSISLDGDAANSPTVSAFNNAGVILNNASLSTDAGNIDVRGNGFGTQDGNYGILETSDSSVTSNTGRISFTGSGGNGGSQNGSDGIAIFVSTVQTTDGNINFIGSSDGKDSGNVGIKGLNGTWRTTGTGQINMSGVGATGINPGSNNNSGIDIQGGSVTSNTNHIFMQGFGSGMGTREMGVNLNNTSVTSTSGTIDIQGNGTTGGTLDNNLGVWIHGGSQVTSSGAIGIIGTGGTGTNTNVGVGMEDASTAITGSGSINISGQGGPGANVNVGISVASSSITAQGSGQLHLTGLGRGSAEANIGILITNSAELSATGSGGIRMDGTGSNNGVDFNNGIAINESSILSVAPISMTGNGDGSGTANGGVGIGGSSITGSDAITIIGVASQSGTTENVGVALLNGSTIFSTANDIDITGTGGVGDPTANPGYLQEFGSNITSSGTNINITTLQGDAIVAQ